MVDAAKLVTPYISLQANRVPLSSPAVQFSRLPQAMSILKSPFVDRKSGFHESSSWSLSFLRNVSRIDLDVANLGTVCSTTEKTR